MKDDARIFAERQLAYFDELMQRTAPVSGTRAAAYRACIRFCGDLQEVMASLITAIPDGKVEKTVQNWIREISTAVWADKPAPAAEKAKGAAK